MPSWRIVRAVGGIVRAVVGVIVRGVVARVDVGRWRAAPGDAERQRGGCAHGAPSDASHACDDISARAHRQTAELSAPASSRGTRRRDDLDQEYGRAPTGETRDAADRLAVAAVAFERTIYLARHGETEWNRIGRWQGATDIPLSDIGRAQARLLADRLRDRQIGRVHASHLSRALETAQIIAARLGAPAPTADPRLRERGYGAFEGLTREECAERFPGVWEQYVADRRVVPPGAEPQAEVIERITAAMIEIATEAGRQSESGADLGGLSWRRDPLFHSRHDGRGPSAARKCCGLQAPLRRGRLRHGRTTYALTKLSLRQGARPSSTAKVEACKRPTSTLFWRRAPFASALRMAHANFCSGWSAVMSAIFSSDTSVVAKLATTFGGSPMSTLDTGGRATGLFEQRHRFVEQRKDLAHLRDARVRPTTFGELDCLLSCPVK